jgi:hypothetical protein
MDAFWRRHSATTEDNRTKSSAKILLPPASFPFRNGKTGSGGKLAIAVAVAEAFQRAASCKACCRAGRNKVASSALVLWISSAPLLEFELASFCCKGVRLVGVLRLPAGPRFGDLKSFKARISFSYVSTSLCKTSTASVN